MAGSRWRQIIWTMLWASVLVQQFIFCTSTDVMNSQLSPVLQRQKRDWTFNIFFTSEELHDLPVKVGKLVNTNSKENTVIKISGEGANDIFIVKDDGEIWVTQTLDREKKSIYNLRAEIRDNRTKQRLEQDAEFVIKLLDINDNKPVFSETFTGFINERSLTGTAVMTVTATDADDPTSPNGILQYKLREGLEYFSIDSKSGVITVTSNKLDRENKSQHTLIVEASDVPGKDIGNTATTTVTININDINDNIANFRDGTFHFSVKESEQPGFKLGTLTVEDRDEKQNKKPRFTLHDMKQVFNVELDENNDGAVILIQALDYESTQTYTFTVTVREDDVVQPPDNQFSMTTASVVISVTDVDEPPVFTQYEYNFTVLEGPVRNRVIGSVSARDPDKANSKIRYSIKGQNCPVEIHSDTGELVLKTELDRELEEKHKCEVTAQELSRGILKEQISYATVYINVQDINDNKPDLANTDNVYMCEGDMNGTMIGTIGASDKDINSGTFRFILEKDRSKFSLYDHLNNSASIYLTQSFSTETKISPVLMIEITDGGLPPLTSSKPLTIKVCKCQRDRRQEYCQSSAQTGVSVSALLAILLCIITILVIVILFVLRKRYQKETLVALGKSAGEIHEQLVTYDEEGGGEMDTNGYDVSILSSAFHGGSLRPSQTIYAVAKKPPPACKGDMAMMIEVKKDEADHDRDGIPYDTLHIYGYEGTESLAGSLSSLDSSSTGSNLDYDVLRDWGPRFRTLAQLYGMDGSDSDSSY